jgi:hypothetical protein
MEYRYPQFVKGLCFICIGASLLFARVDLQTSDPDLKLGIASDAWVESGQFVKYFNQNAVLDRAWINRTFMHFNIDAFYKERAHFSFGMEGRMWFNVPKHRGTGQATYVHRPNNFILISDANASYSFGDLASPYLSLTAGLFPYKYNPQVRNLGEYLFRSGTYPAYLVNTFDLAFARLTGFKVSSELFGMLHQDLIFSIETAVPPFYDGSLTYIADCNLLNIIDIGGGVQFANLVSVDERATTPSVNTTGGGDFLNNMYVDTSNGGRDTGFYTFRGTKLMGKLCFDPKGILALLDMKEIGAMFGKEDFKLYGEAAVLGLESYPANDTYPRTLQKNYWGYNTLKNKIPVVMGFNWPTHPLLSYTVAPGIAGYFLNKESFNSKTIGSIGAGVISGGGIWLLERYMQKRYRPDILAVELEWYGCPYPNSYKKRLGPGPSQSYPVPDALGNHPNMNYSADNWKWSIYTKRDFMKEHLGIIFQVARDHIRNETVIDESFDYEEAVGRNDMWWWMAKIVARF